MTSLETLDTTVESPWIWTIGSARSYLTSQLARVLSDGTLRTWWQPIVDLGSSGRRYGQAVQFRLEDNTFSSLDRLLSVADDLDRYEPFDARLFGTVAALVDLHPGGTVYVPCRPAQLVRLLEELEWPYTRMRSLADQIVLELPEAAFYADPDLKRLIEQAREMGFGFALTQVGTLCTDLNRIERLEPDFVKLDPGFAKGIHAAPLPQLWLLALASFCHQRQILLSAEGIDTEADRACLQRMGCHAGQGPLLGQACPVGKREDMD